MTEIKELLNFEVDTWLIHTEVGQYEWADRSIMLFPPGWIGLFDRNSAGRNVAVEVAPLWLDPSSF